MSRTPIIHTAHDCRTIGVVGDTYRLLATGDDTNGKYATIDALVPPGGGPPPHVHTREEESFYVLEGEITFRVGDQPLVAGPGTFVNMPVGTSHSFRNNSDKLARMLISVMPAGLEQMFIEVGTTLDSPESAAAAPTKSDIDKLLAAAPRYGVQIQLPPH